MSSASSTTMKTNGALLHALIVCAHLMILALLYGQTYFFDYVHFDDAAYVLTNSAVRSGLTLDSVQWAFTSFYASNWHPLTWISHMLDVSLFGIDPGWAHLHNMALHGINNRDLLEWSLRKGGCLDVARQLRREGRCRFLTTGSPDEFRALGERFLQLPIAEVEQVAVRDLELAAA